MPVEGTVLLLPHGKAERMRRGALTLVVLAMVGGATIDTALALQCDGKVVSMGYSTWRVREICGEPANISEVQQLVPRRYYDHQRQTHVETFLLIHKLIWTYNFGTGRLVYLLTFEDDKLTNIETEGYGR